MNGHDALVRAEAVTRNGGTFDVSFYPYSRRKKEASEELRTCVGCTVRTQLPHEKWSIDGKNLFLFADSEGEPKMCHKVLIRYMAFSDDNNKLYKIRWYE